MKKYFLLIILIGMIGTPAFAQKSAKDTLCDFKTYKGKNYLFDAGVKIYECNAAGEDTLKTPTLAEHGFSFNVYGVVNCELIIQFDAFKKDTSKIKKFNGKYFRLRQADMAAYCSEDVGKPYFDINFGTFTTPFKFRPTKSIFTNNLSLGSSINFNHKMTVKDLSWGFVVGISLSSVTLDSLSTSNKVKTNSERPALTPSLGLVLSYKNINFTLGGGIDYINKTSVIEQSWIFNGKPWIGFGIGISLFNSSSTSSTATAKSDDQK